jgi:imidazolonepropionase-like amidohydrolase
MDFIKIMSNGSLLFLSIISSITAQASPEPPSSRISQPTEIKQTLFKNVYVFDGKSAKITQQKNVLVSGNKIQTISAKPILVDSNTQIIEGLNKVLMPGLIDAHWHAMMAAMPMQNLISSEVADINFAAAQESENTLMRGFTSVRDLSGPTFSLKRAIDSNIVNGPRIWPSGAMISQTGGHGDFRMTYEVPTSKHAALSRGEEIGGGVIADGPDEVRKRVREQLMLGASQIKMAAGGGVTSNYDPIDVSQYSEEEFKAGVNAAENWGTYVSVHAYTPRAIQAALKSGVKVIEHAQLLDEATVKMMAEKGAWLSGQAFIDNEYANPVTGAAKEKQLQVFKGTDATFELAKKYNIKIAWGTDILFDPKMTPQQGAILTTMTRWFKPSEVLKMATSTNAELLALSGPRNPYPGKLGVIEQGALADLLLVDGNPLENIELIANPEKSFLVIMKDGVIYKNTTPNSQNNIVLE